MAQKSGDAPKRRGRPRAFEPDAALKQALDVFWREGYAAASLDDLSAATGLNRPSLYGAFGDKRALYIQAYQRYRQRLRDDFGPLFASTLPFPDKLRAIFVAAMELYLSGEAGPRGCFTVLTASSDAIVDPEIRDVVVQAIANMDRGFERLYADARASGALPADADPGRLARMTTAWMHTLSVRARAGVARRELETLIDDAVRSICGATPKR